MSERASDVFLLVPLTWAVIAFTRVTLWRIRLLHNLEKVEASTILLAQKHNIGININAQLLRKPSGKSLSDVLTFQAVLPFLGTFNWTPRILWRFSCWSVQTQKGYGSFQADEARFQSLSLLCLGSHNTCHIERSVHWKLDNQAIPNGTAWGDAGVSIPGLVDSKDVLKILAFPGVESIVVYIRSGHDDEDKFDLWENSKGGSLVDSPSFVVFLLEILCVTLQWLHLRWVEHYYSLSLQSGE